ncbi:MAG: NUDIX domain-containing protein [Janthinobacterium lividum]
MRPSYAAPMKFGPIPAHPDVVLEQQETVWSGRFDVDVVKFRHRRFDGTMSGLRTWEVFRRGPAAALLPYDPWTDQVVLMEQFRLPALAAGMEPVMMEIPAGLCDTGEAPEATVRREIQEEIGLQADRVVPFGDVVLTPGGSDERCSLFAGRVRAPAAGPDGIAGTAGLASEQEDIRVRVLPAALAIERAVDGQYSNSVTMLALLWLAARRERLRAEWLA